MKRILTEGNSKYQRTLISVVIADLVKLKCLTYLQNSCDPPDHFLGHHSNSTIYHCSSPMKRSYHHCISDNVQHKKIKGEICKPDEFPKDLVGVRNSDLPVTL